MHCWYYHIVNEELVYGSTSTKKEPRATLPGLL